MDTSILAKMDGDKVLYLKARPGGDLPEPIVGERYLFCGMVTTPVQSFEKAGDGWRVETENSTYLCWLDTMENAEVFAKSKGLPDPFTHSSGSIYWGMDARLSTYML